MEASAGAVSAGGATQTSSVSPSDQLSNNPAADTAHAEPSKVAKVAAQDEDPEYDFDGEKYKRSQLKDIVKRRKDLDRGAYKAFEEKAELAKKVQAAENAFAYFAKNPEEFFKRTGVDFEQYAQQYMARRLEERMLPQEELERRRQQQEFDQRRQQFEQEREQFQKQRFEQATQHHKEQFASSIMKALQHAGLPTDGEHVSRAAQKLLKAHEHGYSRDSVSIAEELAEEDQALHGRRLAPIRKDGAALAKLLGDDGLSTIKSYLIEQEKQKLPNQQRQAQSAQSKVYTNPEHPNGYVTMDEIREAELKRNRR